MIKEIWEEQPPGFYCMSLKDLDGNWRDNVFETINSALAWMNKSKELGDLYFCITSLSDKRRVKGCVQASRYLWQDLDEVKPDSLGDLKPTVAWQSSPGRYQAVWRLDHLCEPKELEELNKALAYKVGADQGSWILTKVLRIPGTRNHKYPEQPTVKQLWNNGSTFRIADLQEALKIPASEPTISVAGPSLDWKRIYTKYKDKIPRKVRRLLDAEKAVKGKRSDILWYLEHELLNAGLRPKEVVVLVKASVWNKYRGRDSEDDILEKEVAKIISEGGDKEDRKKKEEFDNIPEDNLFSLVLENDHELMTDIHQYPSWMVEGFWTRKSHGIIAGEPKSFKSTLILDMAVSVASGKKFLNQFPVIDTGPVLMVQNENAPWIMKDRLIKIRSDRGLVGEVTKVHGIYEVKFPVRLPLYYINQQGFNFNEPFHRKILDKIMSRIQPRMVIFDPLYLMFDGDVNQSKDLNPILNWLLNLKTKHDCSLALIHHWKKGTQGTKIRGGQRMLGSTTLHGWVESAWYLDVRNSEELEGEMPSDEFNAPSGSATLTLEREFRGAGMYPRLDLKVKMGDFGSTDYSVKIEKHRKEREEVNEVEAKKSIKDLLELRGGSASIRDINKELGLSRRIARKLLRELKGGKEEKSP